MGKGEGKGRGKGKFMGCDGLDEKKLEKHPPRKCTDVLFLALFFGFCVGMFYIAGWCFDNGQPYRIVYGADSWGNVCGQDNTDIIDKCEEGGIEMCGLDMTERKHLFYSSVGAAGADALDNTQKVMICTNECPSAVVDCTANIAECRRLGVCFTPPYNVSLFFVGHPDCGIVVDGDCTGCPDAVGVTFQASVLYRCLPDPTADTGAFTGVIGEQINSFVSYSNAESYIGDIVQSFAGCLWECFYLLIIALALSLAVVILMRYFIAPIVYICILLAIVASICVTSFLYTRYEYTDADITAQEDLGVTITDSETNERDFYLYSSWLFMILTVLVVLVVIVCRNEIKAAIRVYKCASDAIKAMPSMLLTPLILWTLLVGWAALWIMTMVFMISADTFVTVNATVGTGYGHVKYIPMENYDNFFWYFTFGLLWISQFFIAVGQLIMAGCVTRFYVTTGAPGRMIFCRMSGIVFRYHLGTACLGSLIIAIVQFIRVIFEYIKNKTKGDDKSAIQKFVEKCFTCCLWCLEECLKYINKNAYIETMLYGMSFCSACCTALKTLLSNIVKIAMLSFVGTLVIFCIKLFVSATTAFIAFEWIKDKNDVPLVGLVVFIVALVSWFIADAFASIYEMTAGTLMLCYCEDLDANSKDSLIGPPKLTGRIAKNGGVKDGKADGKADKNSDTLF